MLFGIGIAAVAALALLVLAWICDQVEMRQHWYRKFHDLEDSSSYTRSLLQADLDRCLGECKRLRDEHSRILDAVIELQKLFQRPNLHNLELELKDLVEHITWIKANADNERSWTRTIALEDRRLIAENLQQRGCIQRGVEVLRDFSYAFVDAPVKKTKVPGGKNGRPTNWTQHTPELVRAIEALLQWMEDHTPDAPMPAAP